MIEYSYMENSVILDMHCTVKNVESTPAFPKFLEYASEEDYLRDCGMREYVEVWNCTQRKRPLWWTFLKYETLKKAKIEKGDIRMIMCTDPVFTRFGACFEQHQNELMKDKTESHYAQIGWTPFYGGIDQRLKRLSSIGNQVVETDWTRFDGTIPNEVFRTIKDIRWFYHGSKYKTPENKDRYDWYVSNLMTKMVLLPTGEVTCIKNGNPSGQISTTTDNNMVNTFLTAFELAYFHQKQHGTIPTAKEIRENFDMLVYGDDRLMTVNKNFVDYKLVNLPDFYKDVMGMWMKPENVKVLNSFEGASFCGFTFTKTSAGWVGTPNVDKILSTLSKPVRALPDVTALWGKLLSLRILVENSADDVKRYLEKQIFRVREFAQAEGIELPEVPDYFYSRLWSGGPKNYVGSEATACQTSEAEKTAPKERRERGRHHFKSKG